MPRFDVLAPHELELWSSLCILYDELRDVLAGLWAQHHVDITSLLTGAFWALFLYCVLFIVVEMPRPVDSPPSHLMRKRR